MLKRLQILLYIILLSIPLTYWEELEETWSTSTGILSNTGTELHTGAVTPINTTNSTGTTQTTQNDNNIKTGLDNLNDKKNTLVSELSWNWNSELEKQIQEYEKQKNIKVLEVESLKQLNQQLQDRIQVLEKDSTSNEQEKIELQKKINTLNTSIRSNIEKISTLESEKVNYDLILNNLAVLKSNLESQQDHIFITKVHTLEFLLWILISGIILSTLLYKYIKNLPLKNTDKRQEKQREQILTILNVINVLFTLVFIITIIWWILYIKPDLAVWFLFFWSAFILNFRDIILSFIWSIIVLWKYKIWEVITYDKNTSKSWEISRFKPLTIILKEIDNKTWLFTWNLIDVPNNFIFDTPVQKSITNFVERYSNLELLLSKDTINIEKMKEFEHQASDLLKHIDKNELLLYWRKDLGHIEGSFKFTEKWEAVYQYSIVGDKKDLNRIKELYLEIFFWKDDSTITTQENKQMT